MPRFRLLAVDLDGTLLDSRFRVSDVNRHALERADRAGVTLVVVTGRRLPAALEVLDGVDVDPWLVLNGGALVKENRSGPVVARTLLPRRTAAEVLAVGRELGAYPVLHDGPEAEGRLVIANEASSHPALAIYLERSDPPPVRVASLEAWLDRDLVEVMFADGPAEIDRMASELSKRLGPKVSLARTVYPRRNFAILDVLASACSKAGALGFVAERRGVTLAETMAIGDNWNDLEMLEAVGLGVVMGNAVPEIRSRGFRVTGTNDEDGVAAAIERYLL